MTTCISHDPAFPHPDNAMGGLTIREYAAIHILAGFAAVEYSDRDLAYMKECASLAVDWADALIDALNAPKPPKAKKE